MGLQNTLDLLASTRRVDKTTLKVPFGPRHHCEAYRSFKQLSSIRLETVIAHARTTDTLDRSPLTLIAVSASRSRTITSQKPAIGYAAKRRMIHACKTVPKPSDRECELLDWLVEERVANTATAPLNMGPKTVETYQKNKLRQLEDRQAAVGAGFESHTGAASSCAAN